MSHHRGSEEGFLWVRGVEAGQAGAGPVKLDVCAGISDYWTGLQDLKSGLAGLQKGKGLGNSRRLGGEWIRIWRWELIWTCHI